MSSSEQEDIIYEEDEVLWAKIRGYPWWPAYVDKIHQNNRGGQAEYTVFFFGDNTQYSSSKLGASKLRKFYDNYAEFYPKARTHRKLYLSIQMAEDRLKQNDQNIEIFEQLRNSLKSGKRSKSKYLNRKQSKISQPEPQLSQNKQEILTLNKVKTQGCKRGRRPNKQSLQKHQQSDDIIDKQIKKQKPSRRSQRNHSNDKKSMLDERIQDEPPKQKVKSVQKESFYQQQDEQKLIKSPKKVEVSQQIIEKVKKQKPSKNNKLKQIDPVKIKVQESASQMDEQPQQLRPYEQSSSNSILQQRSQQDDAIYEKKLRNSIKRKQIVLSSPGPRKRGRPKKNSILRHHNLHDQRSERILRKHKSSRLMNLKRKMIHRVRQPQKISISQPLTDNDIKIIENIKKLMSKRDDLVDYLRSINITVGNVKQILDLNVTNILQNGQITPQINELQQMFKATILYKYFPLDLKHKKKYEKMIKKKKASTQRQDNDEQMQQEQNHLSFEEQEIRKKTTVKLQKFLKAHPDIDGKAREMAMKIQSYFEKADKKIGDKYKSIAYKVLTNLKDQKQHFAQIMVKLDQNTYE